MFRKLLDNTRPKSLANKFRKERFELFKELINDLDPPVTILDIGGTENFWEQMGLAGNDNFKITILNISVPDIPEKLNMKFLQGNASDPGMFPDKSFDVVFSNSVIEHIPEPENRKKMADEIMRTGKYYFVQTPNYYFPFEPHFLFPFFQFLPVKIKVFMLMNFNMGWFTICNSKDKATELLRNNKLLKLKEFKMYFGSGKIFKEKFLFMNKSFTVINK